MPYSSQALFDTDIGAQLARRFCSPGTRIHVLASVEQWAISLNPFSASGYWISGMAGTGKSTIAMSICQNLKNKGLLAGSFFCSRQIPECRDYRLIVPTLSYQLAKFSGAFATALKNILTRDLDLATKRPVEQVEYLLVEPWNAVSDMFKKAHFIPVFVIDALDEC
ncbi:hypothetical protein GYMLUDRAFT_157563, partial [Collybiopsis luxurians FD-317 M1]